MPENVDEREKSSNWINCMYRGREKIVGRVKWRAKIDFFVRSHQLNQSQLQSWFNSSIAFAFARQDDDGDAGKRMKIAQEKETKLITKPINQTVSKKWKASPAKIKKNENS